MSVQAVQQVLIVGSGFAGLCTGIKLLAAGIRDFTILEAAPSLGGTWRDNTYPGAACDVQSHLYSFSFAPNPRWTRAYPRQGEILSYMEEVASRFKLRPHLRFDARVEGARFDEERDVWDVTLASGEVLSARALVSACGALSKPATPSIPGLESFERARFHSSRWDHELDFNGKRVGVIGTGASAIQFVPQIAPQVARLDLFQRTPPWVLPKDDRAISERERRWFARFPSLQKLVRLGIYWRLEARVLPFVLEPRIMKWIERGGREHLRAAIKDPELRARLTPDYTIGCKRILISNDYYPALELPQVNVVSEGIERITPTGVVTCDGVERELDALILATGFHASENSIPFEIRGRGGRDLEEAWGQGAEAYLGTVVAGFPNLFLLVGPNTGLGHSSMIFMIESQVRYVIEAIRSLRLGRARVEVKAEVQARYNQRLHQRLDKTVWSAGCKSWYQTRSGRNTTLWPGFTWEFRQRTRRLRPGDLVS